MLALRVTCKMSHIDTLQPWNTSTANRENLVAEPDLAVAGVPLSLFKGGDFRLMTAGLLQPTTQAFSRICGFRNLQARWIGLDSFVVLAAKNGGILYSMFFKRYLLFCLNASTLFV